MNCSKLYLTANYEFYCQLASLIFFEPLCYSQELCHTNLPIAIHIFLLVYPVTILEMCYFLHPKICIVIVAFIMGIILTLFFLVLDKIIIVIISVAIVITVVVAILVDIVIVVVCP